jgi:hypothetical protein
MANTENQNMQAYVRGQMTARRKAAMKRALAKDTAMEAQPGAAPEGSPGDTARDAKLGIKD